MSTRIVYLGSYKVRKLNNKTAGVCVPLEVIERTSLVGGMQMLANFDRDDGDLLYRPEAAIDDPLSGEGPGGEIHLGSYKLRELNENRYALTVPSDVVQYTGLSIGDELNVYWDPSMSGLIYRPTRDDNPLQVTSGAE